MTTTVQALADFRYAFYEMAVAVFAERPEVLVKLGLPNQQYANDFVEIDEVDMDADVATMGNRAFDLTAVLTVTAGSYRTGMDIALVEKTTFDTMIGLFDALAEQLRKPAPDGDTTLGGTVRQCFLTNLETESAVQKAEAGNGRLWEGRATFTAQIRVKG